jgi:replicative DNA helicase
MTNQKQEQQSKAQIAAKHLVGNLWYDLDTLPLIAARLNPDTMATAVGGDAALAYGEMCKLLRSTEKLTAGKLEANLRVAGFNFSELTRWQADLNNDGIDNLYQYVAEIQNAADLHELKGNLVDGLKATNDADAKAERIKANLMAQIIRTERVEGGPRHIGEIVQEVRQELKAVRDGTGSVGMSTGFASLDKVFRLKNGEYTTIGGRPSQGKTSLVIQVVYKVARQLKADGIGQVLVFSLDDTRRKLVRALACTVAMVDSTKLLNHEATAADWEEVDKAEDEIEELPIWIDDTSGLSAEDIHYRTAMQNVTTPVRLIVIDYIEKVSSKVTDELVRLRRIASDCKELGKTFDCPVVMLSQITKDVEKRADRWPTSSDLKYAGEEESDVIVLVHRPEHYISKGESIDCNEQDKQGIVLVSVAKNKEGKVGLVRLGFKKEYARFADLQFEHVDLNE